MCAKSLQLCPTFCGPTGCNWPGYPVHGILQEILEWVTMPSSKEIFLTQGLNPCLVSPALVGRFFTTSATWEALGNKVTIIQNFHYSTLHTPVLQAHPHPLNASIFKLFPRLLGLSTKEQVDLFDPVFVIRLVCLGVSSVNWVNEVCQVTNKIKKLTDIIWDRGAVSDALHIFYRQLLCTYSQIHSQRKFCLLASW